MPLYNPPGSGAHPDLATHEALGIVTDTDLTTHDADTTVVHGIADTSALSLTSHDHDADYEAAGGIATHSADTTSVHGLADTSVLATDTEVATAVSDHSADSTAVHGITDTAALSLDTHDHDADYEAAGGIATHSADTTAVHGITDTAALSLDTHDHDADYEATGAVATHAGLADPHTGYQKESEKSAVSGYASLDAGTKVPIAELPTGTTGTTVALGDAAAALDATHAAAGDPHTGYRLESADHSHASTGLQAGTVAHTALTAVGANDHHAQAHTHPAEGAVVVTHASTTGQGTDDHHAQSHTHASHTGIGADDHHAQLHTAAHLPTGTDPVNKFSQSTIGTADQAIANTETVVLAKVFAADELVAGQHYRFEAWFTKAGTNAASAVIRIRIGTTTLTGNIAATLTPPTNALAVPGKIEGLLWIVANGAGGTARGSLQQFVHLAAVTITSAISPATGTVAVNTTTANQRVELTFISGNAANTYTFRNAVMYRVA